MGTRARALSTLDLAPDLSGSLDLRLGWEVTSKAPRAEHVCLDQFGRTLRDLAPDLSSSLDFDLLSFEGLLQLRDREDLLQLDDLSSALRVRTASLGSSETELLGRAEVVNVEAVEHRGPLSITELEVSVLLMDRDDPTLDLDDIGPNRQLGDDRLGSLLDDWSDWSLDYSREVKDVGERSVRKGSLVPSAFVVLEMISHEASVRDELRVDLVLEASDESASLSDELGRGLEDLRDLLSDIESEEVLSDEGDVLVCEVRAEEVDV